MLPSLLQRIQAPMLPAPLEAYPTGVRNTSLSAANAAMRIVPGGGGHRMSTGWYFSFGPMESQTPSESRKRSRKSVAADDEIASMLASGTPLDDRLIKMKSKQKVRDMKADKRAQQKIDAEETKRGKP
jgi:hypothetical protein